MYGKDVRTCADFRVAWQFGEILEYHHYRLTIC